MNPLPSAAAPARSSCPPAWQTVGLRARALAELFQPAPDAGPRGPSPWLRRLAWAHHGICLALVLELVLAIALAFVPGPAAAHSARVGALRIAHPHAPPTPGGVQVGAVYFKALHNEGREPDQLLGTSTPVAAAVEIHRMELDGDRMRMRRVEALDLPAGTRLSLRPGEPGHHLMLLGLKRPLQVGDKLPLTLRFARAGTVTVEVWVEAATGAGPDPHAGHGPESPPAR